MVLKKILFIDDQRELHQELVNLFPKDKFRVLSAFDGADALQKCRNEDFDLIISEYRLPRLDGVRFYAQLREAQELKKVLATPILYVSAEIEEMKTKRPRWQKTDFMAKPLDMNILMEKSYRFLGMEYNAVSSVKSDKRAVNPGDVIFDIGEVSDNVYFVVSGNFSAYKREPDGREVLVTKIGMGELIGDVAVVIQSNRLLKVVADEPGELLAIPADKITSIINGQSKWVKLMLQNLCRRLEDAAKRIV